MKNFLLLFSVLFIISSCDPDEEPTVGPGYPTDGLVLERAATALLLTGYHPAQNSSVAYQAEAMLMKKRYGDSLCVMSLVVDAANPLYNSGADTISRNFLLTNNPMAPFQAVDLETPMPTQTQPSIDAMLLEKPLADVNHVVSENDTAYVIDSKVQFYQDTLSNGVFIETYLLGKIRAKEYDNGMLNLTMPSSNNVISNNAEGSFYEFDLLALDSTENVIEKGQEYFHNYVMIDQFSNTYAFGTQMNEYWDFGGEFKANDILGNQFRPIRHHFLKKPINKMDFDFEPAFLTVVWVLNPMTVQVEPVNCVVTTLEITE